jgi:DNA helicase II / ATP-dependent DNA helicase PcrA
MPSSDNRVIIACAGSGKTTRLVEEALKDPDKRIAMVTYTNSNAREIKAKFGERNSGVPGRVDVLTWFEFLLRECARPYQKAKFDRWPVTSMLFVEQRSTKGISEANTPRYYFSSGRQIYSDKVARFAFECETRSHGRVSGRLARIYTDIFVDEFQDLAGWDLEVIEFLLRSPLRVTLVGDPRQFVYRTNPSGKNSQYLGVGIVQRVHEWEKAGLCASESMSKTYRCSEEICAFSNLLWPGMEPMVSEPRDSSDHEGVFLVGEDVVERYLWRFGPRVLRQSKRSPSPDADPLNFGSAKGLEFERVLIVPTGPIKKYLETGDLKHVEKGKQKLHVAVTRARRSVAFLFAGDSPTVRKAWRP